MEGGAKINKKPGFPRHRLNTTANPPQLGFRSPRRNLPPSPSPSPSPSSPSSLPFRPDTAPSIISDVALASPSSSSLLSLPPSRPDTAAPFIIRNDALGSSLPSPSPPPPRPTMATPLIIHNDALASSASSPLPSPLRSRLNTASPLIIRNDALASSSSSSSPSLLPSCLDMAAAAPLIIRGDALEEGGLPPIPHLPRSHDDRKGKAAVVSSHASCSQKREESGNQGDSEKRGEFIAQSSSSSAAAAASSGTLQWAVKGIRRDSRNMSETMPVSKESNGWRSTHTNRVIDLESPHNTYEPHLSHKRAQSEAVHQEGEAYDSNGVEEAHRNGGLSDGHIPMPSSDRSLSVRTASKPSPPKRRRISMEPEGISIDLSEVEGTPTPRVGGRKRRRRSTQQQSTSAGFHQLIDIDDLESPRNVGAQETERERELEKERQIAEDERLARLLQQEYQSEVRGGDLMRNLRPLQHLGTRTDMNSVPVRAFLTGPGSSSSAQRLRSARFQRATGVGRVRRRGFVTSGGRSLHLPRQMNVDTRMELLATLETLETALHLMHDDRDFNANDYEMLLALDENNDRHTGASHERIQMLPVSTVKDTDVVEEACSICLDEPVAGDKIRRLPCMHGFHQQCIDQWLERQSKCPVCKASI